MNIYLWELPCVCKKTVKRTTNAARIMGNINPINPDALKRDRLTRFSTSVFFILEIIAKSHVNTSIAFGGGTLSNIVSRENFLVMR